ncbi:upstream-binding protein 1 isoform X2 [Venturia canescens]|uniref:upstream-binding protein 1 isoform X2 n=1 Tax=Venturia canescens TaxID=32260 RepID=UPI001C9BF95E|nr:upstream-binding protein 1 isoform X2 [Venturia canescens]
MELQMIMDSGSETLNASANSMWLGSSSSPPQPPPYHRLSPNRQEGRSILSNQQVSMGYHEASSQHVLWQDKRDKHSTSPSGNNGDVNNVVAVVSTNREQHSSLAKHSSTTNFNQSTINGLKRRLGGEAAHQHMSGELDRKHPRSVGSNGSGQGWTSTQVDEFAEHLAADFDGPLSALAASDLANAVASYNMSEALLALPSLTVFKQEAPSPEHHGNNSNLNHTQHSTNNNGVGALGSSEADSNNNNTTHNNEIATTTEITTSNGTSPGSTTSVNNHSQHNNSVNNRHATANLHQLLYSSSEDYQSNSSSGNHVSSSSSSSQQGNEFNEDSRFQYVLAAATSIATKLNEETLTYLNQGQSYEIKLKKLGDLSAYRGKILKSNIRICFHERRLQYTEREQMLAWQRARPGERLLEVDVPLSYGMVDVAQSLPSKNSVEFMWDPTKEVGVYIKVNCISTEFTPKKHGGEKGVPFRILVETRLPDGPRLHAASCQVKVFKLKGADRKHKQDRDKILRRPPHEQDKYQPSYDCTVLSDIPLDSLSPSSSTNPNEVGNSFVVTPDVITSQSRRLEIGNASSSSSVVGIGTGVGQTLSQSPQVVNFMNGLETSKGESHADRSSMIVDTTAKSKTTTIESSSLETNCIVREEATGSKVDRTNGENTDSYQLSADANVAQTNAWLRARRFSSFQETFASFSAQDILRLSRDDLIQICGLADGIRLFNALHSKAPQPKLTLYFAIEGSAVSPWRVIYLENLNSALLASKLLATLNLPHDRLHSVLIQGPQGVHVLVSNELVANIKDESMYLVETIKDCSSERYKLLLKPSSSSSSR